MADEYIRKQDASDAVIKHLQLDYDYAWGVREAINGLSAADVVPVVRCKDCKHCYFADNRVPDEQGWVCEINSSEPVNLNGFCSYGERKE